MKEAIAGTLESGDIMVTISPGEGLQVELQSSVAAQFGRQIKAVITETLARERLCHICHRLTRILCCLSGGQNRIRRLYN